MLKNKSNLRKLIKFRENLKNEKAKTEIPVGETTHKQISEMLAAYFDQQNKNNS